MKLVRMGLALSFVLWTNSALAWNGRGHMIVAAVAWAHMTPASQARAAALLKLNPMYATWISGVPAAKQDQVAFVVAATWPDIIKHTTGYTNDGEKPINPGASQNIGYSDKLMHKYWHYIDVPFSPDHTPLVQPIPPNAETQIEAFRTAIASPPSDDVESYDMVWLEHLVGDVHQPLHATSRFTKTFPSGDQGGNLVCLTTSCSSELHAFWDNALGLQTSGASDADNAMAAIAVAAGLAAAPPVAAGDGDDTHWIKESFTIAKKSVYATPIKNGKGPYKLTAAYKAKAAKIAKQRAELAGERLANLYNSDLH